MLFATSWEGHRDPSGRQHPGLLEKWSCSLSSSLMSADSRLPDSQGVASLICIHIDVLGEQEGKQQTQLSSGGNGLTHALQQPLDFLRVFYSKLLSCECNFCKGSERTRIGQSPTQTPPLRPYQGRTHAHHNVSN